jgi:hypothetical protein
VVREVIEVLLPVVLGMQIVGIGGLVAGWLLSVEPAEPQLARWFTADTEPLKVVEPPKPPPSVLETLRLASAVSHRRTVSWPVPAPGELKNDTTRPIRADKVRCRTSYLHDEGQHRTPDSLSRAPGWTGDLPIVTEARLDWSSHPTVQQSRLPEVLDEVSG